MDVSNPLAEFYANPDPRCPCVLVLDTSRSMHGPRIDELNRALTTFRDDLLGDSLAAQRVEVAVITFSTEVVLAQDFVTPDGLMVEPLQARGQTQMAPALHQAIDLVEQRRALYKQAALPCYTPWVFLITDGRPHAGFCPEMRRAAERIAEGEKRRALAFYAVGVEDADLSMLAQVGVRPPVKLQGVKFNEMFLWLSQSLRTVSRSRLDERAPLAPLTGWAEAP